MRSFAYVMPASCPGGPRDTWRGSSTSANRDGEEERAAPPFVVVDLLDDLKAALQQPGTGTWLSLVMTLSASGTLDIDDNYDEKPDFGFEVSAHDYSLELQRFPRADEAVPAWWQERIAQGGPS
ncbi:hypothetical protein FDK12_06655 [Arthrobacter sp. NamB2]|uniref:hypothetical protein n=1 Tax=Arthrobacter sp. NamB2 TaxID=2576035 RepID=UPI0010CA071A|nr:hypothetical protein [Arthrobacter sp. NamB2]TKV28347.1 hypothetical protein FDK12_06655 [Arthrobacter sp. NamB2]